MSGKLYLVPTPIGNLKDMTFRAVEILKESDVVLAEDTRNSGILLKHYEIETPMRSYHMHNEHQATEDIIRVKVRRKELTLLSNRFNKFIAISLRRPFSRPSIERPSAPSISNS